MIQSFRRHLPALAFALGAALALPLPASAFETRATAAYVVDHNTGTVLLSRDADVPLPPASMSKLMTLNMLFEAVDDGRIDMDTTFTVSSRARQMGGSKMFVDERDRPTAEDLIRGIAVLSGNDASVVVAEGLAGSEEAFARLATERARALGMNQTTIANASGWPHPEHRMSMRDLAILAQRLIEEFPDYYPYLSEREFTWNDITQNNRVPLLDAGIGLDGLKTGHTSEAGFGLVGSAQQGARRVTFVITGLNSERERAEEAERLINWAFRQFVERKVLDAGQQVAEADVWLGEAPRVGLVAAEDVRLLFPASAPDAPAAEVIYQGPIQAPVTRGQQLAELVVQLPDQPERRIPLVAESDVAAGGFAVRLRTAAQVLFQRMIGAGADAGA
ncbi:D-alanyl-D-alanine carboxypeptidase family protein [Alkalilacustris brevis]|uniref:D-alanyl-D-alanine carboxypeptidase family protein n=1 Tax=Alkalilacustris brevis TaxID=2026338 RepID=UPI000E0D0EA1|nr:D-alanyl-D-alanine carboxypeptidase family protein [Alkalilacustris brevis]